MSVHAPPPIAIRADHGWLSVPAILSPGLDRPVDLVHLVAEKDVSAGLPVRKRQRRPPELVPAIVLPIYRLPDGAEVVIDSPGG